MNLQEHNVSDNNFEQCIKCTVCTVYCPVAAVNPDFPGPKQAGPDGERLRLKKNNFYDETLKYCLNCKRCEVACPSNVLVGTLSSPFAPVVNGVLGLRPTKAVLDSVLKIDHRRVFPKYAFGTIESWYKKNEAARQSSFPTQVSYFHGCYVNYNNPQLGKDLIKVMNALGVGVRLLDKEKCCGVALISNGFIEQAKKQAKVNIEAIRESVLAKNMPVIATSSTCAFTIRDEYPHLLSVDNADVREQVELATRYVYRLMARQGVKLKFKQNQKIRVAYHTPCHMEKLGWAYYSIELLKLIPNVELTVLDSQCCGIAGTYGFKKENYKTSQDIGESLFRQIEACDIDYVVTDCETCKWQIEMSTSKRCEHPISILAKALE